MGVLDEFEQQEAEERGSATPENVKPANPMRQREILDKPIQLKGAAKYWASTKHGHTTHVGAGKQGATTELTPPEYERKPRYDDSYY